MEVATLKLEGRESQCLSAFRMGGQGWRVGLEVITKVSPIWRVRDAYVYVRVDRGCFPVHVYTCAFLSGQPMESIHATPQSQRKTRNAHTHKRHVKKNTVQPWSYTSHTFGVNIHSTYASEILTKITCKLVQRVELYRRAVFKKNIKSSIHW